MEEQFCARRAKLRQVLREYPTYSNRQLAQAVECSMNWVKKWKKRLREADPQDEKVLWNRSSARKTPQPKPTRDPRIVARVLEIRDHPPDNLQRVPGPKTISYFLNKDQVLKDLKLIPPTSTSTIWEILVEKG
ncbi:MAG: hypothetical protein HXX20_04950 [Chloroflexi bacterium]|nr:hypothetical protein [Chloroflexota bacterium]